MATTDGSSSCAEDVVLPASPVSTASGKDPLVKLLHNNRAWSQARLTEDPTYFDHLMTQQNPEYLWIGCSDSRVPANVILGLDPGEVFVQRNVGNQATHTDLNCMSCLEYSVKELKVRNILVCGHYGCGAVKAALKLPSKTQGLVNCWISDIRECRNQHRSELMALPNLDDQVYRLCELNVLRQTFNVCTSPVVQAAWDQGQELHIYGVIYSLKNGLLKKLVGPINGNGDFEQDQVEFEAHWSTNVPPVKPTSQPMSIGDPRTSAPRVANSGAGPNDIDGMTPTPSGYRDELAAYMNTVQVNNRIAEHVGWSVANASNPGTPH